jgi:prevent-host-death family protein
MVAKKREMAAGEFKAKCLQVMDQVARRKQPVVVTKRGKPVVKIVPIEDDVPRSILGSLAGRFEITGDVESPVLPASLWETSK